MSDYEKLGAFYLGKEYDLDIDKQDEDLVLYKSKDLTTHAVIIGMTGSGIAMTKNTMTKTLSDNNFMFE